MHLFIWFNSFLLFIAVNNNKTMCSVHWVHVYFEVIIIHESLDSVNKDNISSNVHM